MWDFFSTERVTDVFVISVKTTNTIFATNAILAANAIFVPIRTAHVAKTAPLVS